MNYLEAIDAIKKIEDKYDVMSIKYKGVSVWPFLRVYICDSLAVNKQQKMSSSNVMLVLKTLFAYNPFVYFKGHDLWTFSSQNKRKQLGEKWIAPISGGLTDICPNALTIEWPNKNRLFLSKKNLNEKYIISASWLLLMGHAIEILRRPFKIQLEGEDIMKSILNELDLSFDYNYFVRYMIAQKKTMDICLAICKKPKVVFFECPCTCMGFIWSMHKHDIPIVEMQHGVLNSNHYAYNSKFRSDLLFPDEICVFGEIEYDYLTKENPVFCKNVTQTGSYILEKSVDFFSEDIFKEFRSKYKKIVVVAGQMVYENEMSDFVKEVAPAYSDVLFIYIPRHPDTKIDFEGKPNIVFRPNVNIYQYLMWCDIHMTISSTTCLECQFLKKPTIFYNKYELATQYYGNILEEINGAVYINGADELENAFNYIENTKFEYKNIFAHNHTEKLRKVVEKYINKQ